MKYSVQVEHYTEKGHFIVKEVQEVGDDEYTLESVLQVFDLKEDTRVVVNIKNDAGEIAKSFNIIVPTSTTTTTTTTTTANTTFPVIIAEEQKYVVYIYPTWRSYIIMLPGGMLWRT